MQSNVTLQRAILTLILLALCIGARGQPREPYCNRMLICENFRDACLNYPIRASAGECFASMVRYTVCQYSDGTYDPECVVKYLKVNIPPNRMTPGLIEKILPLGYDPLPELSGWRNNIYQQPEYRSYPIDKFSEMKPSVYPPTGKEWFDCDDRASQRTFPIFDNIVQIVFPWLHDMKGIFFPCMFQRKPNGGGSNNKEKDDEIPIDWHGTGEESANNNDVNDNDSGGKSG